MCVCVKEWREDTELWRTREGTYYYYYHYYHYYHYYTHTHTHTNTHTYAQDYISPFINIFTFPAIHPDVNGWTKGTRYTGMYVKVVKYYT